MVTNLLGAQKSEGFQSFSCHIQPFRQLQHFVSDRKLVDCVPSSCLILDNQHCAFFPELKVCSSGFTHRFRSHCRATVGAEMRVLQFFNLSFEFVDFLLESPIFLLYFFFFEDCVSAHFVHNADHGLHRAVLLLLLGVDGVDARGKRADQSFELLQACWVSQGLVSEILRHNHFLQLLVCNVFLS